MSKKLKDIGQGRSGLPVGNPGNVRMGKSAVEAIPVSASDPGPKNPLADSQAPSSVTPPSTDRGDMSNFWFPFSRAQRRIEEGGWARQITVRDLPISKTIAGVNMRLIAGGIREMHWHKASEWALMLYGNARITSFDDQQRTFVQDVKEGDLWYFPSGFPHSIQGLGPDGCEFLLVFDDGNFSEDTTFLFSDWLAHTPVDVLSKNFGLPEGVFKDLPQNELYIFPGKTPDSLKIDQKTSIGSSGTVPQSFMYQLYDQKPDVETKGGSARIVDSSKFPISKGIAAAYVTLHPGAMREMHWHPNADEWLYVIEGKAKMTVFGGVGSARTMDFDAGDVGYIPKTMGHFLVNTGDTDLRYLEMFASSYFSDISLTNWMSHTPPELVAAHMNVSKNEIEKLPKKKTVIVP